MYFNNYAMVDCYDRTLMHWFKFNINKQYLEIVIFLTQVNILFDNRLSSSFIFLEGLTSKRPFLLILPNNFLKIKVSTENYVDFLLFLEYYLRTFYLKYISKSWIYKYQKQFIKIKFFNLNKLYFKNVRFKKNDFLEISYIFNFKVIPSICTFFLEI